MHGPVKVSAAPGQPADENPSGKFNKVAAVIKATAAIHRSAGAVGDVPPEEARTPPDHSIAGRQTKDLHLVIDWVEFNIL